MDNQLAVDMDYRDIQIRNLRGAICDYIDDNSIDELIEDLIMIATEEEKSFRQQADSYKKIKNMLMKKSK